MRTLGEADFITWTRAHGMVLHESYPKTAILTFTPDAGWDRFWPTPSEPERRPHFIATMLDLLGDWASCFVWKHSGSWHASADPLRINDRVELEILRGLGMPLGAAQVVEFDRPSLIALLP
jgi:hypothetical protein